MLSRTYEFIGFRDPCLPSPMTACYCRRPGSGSEKRRFDRLVSPIFRSQLRLKFWSKACSQHRTALDIATMPAKSRRCLGVINGTLKCTLARNGSKAPIVVTRACRRCREWRCRTHCRCGRQGHLQGRQAARPGAPAEAKVQPKTTAHDKVCARP